MIYRYKEIPGKLYCTEKMMLNDITEFMRKEFSIDVTCNVVRKWIDKYISKNLNNLTFQQKKMLLIKSIIENDGKDYRELVEKLKKDWRYNVSYILMFSLISSYKKIKKMDAEIRYMLKDNSPYVVADKFKVDRDMFLFLFDGKEKEEG